MPALLSSVVAAINFLNPTIVPYLLWKTSPADFLAALEGNLKSL